MTESHKYTEPLNSLDDSIIPTEKTIPEPDGDAEETPISESPAGILPGTDLEGNNVEDVLDDDLSWR